MRKGDVINGYVILANPTNANAGMSEWTFAEKRVADVRKEYFIKRFLTPVYLDDSAPAPEVIKKKKREACERFEAHHRRVIKALKTLTHEEGNLNVPVEIFRHGSHYYKVTRKVDVSNLSLEAIARLDFRQRLIILKTIANSLKILHDKGIVHGDLKPTNILIKRTESGMYTTKLIDFDNAYFVGEPPDNREELIVDAVYASPEQYFYMRGEASADDLGTRSDIFSLGMIYHQYLTGELPRYDPAKFRYPYQAVLNGEPLQVDPLITPPELYELLTRMFAMYADTRPTMDDVVNTLMPIKADRGETIRMPAAEPTPAAVPTVSAPASSGVIVRGMKPKAKPGEPPAGSVSGETPAAPDTTAPAEGHVLPPVPEEPTIRPMRKKGSE